MVPWRGKGGRWYAALYDRVTRLAEERLLADLRRWLVGEVRGRVIEIGVGTGATFPYYPEATQVEGIEPNPFMLLRAQRRLTELGRRSISLHLARAEHLPFRAGVFDTAVVTLVLCTVGDVGASLAELRRVLRPGGQLRFIEHVRNDGHWAGWLQDILTIPWSRLSGCHLNRRTIHLLSQAGFEITEQRRHIRYPGPALLVGPVIGGVARAGG